MFILEHPCSTNLIAGRTSEQFDERIIGSTMKKHLRSKCFFSYIRRAASYIAFGSEIRLSPSDIRFASFSANIISLRRRRNITFAAGRNITPGGVRHII